MFFGNHVLLILSPVRSPSPDTKKALEALAAVERLQSQLLWVLPLTVLYRSKHANWIKVILTCSWFHDRWPWKQACPFVSNHRTILMIFFRRWSNGRKRDPVKLFALAAAYCSKNLFVWMGLSRGFKLRHNNSNCVIIVTTVSLILTRARARSVTPLYLEKMQFCLHVILSWLLA